MNRTIKTVTKKRPIPNLESLFWAYFNNKMMMLLMLIEHPVIGQRTFSVKKQELFLHDLYHHFLPQGTPTKYHRAFKWLNLFLAKFPCVNHVQIRKAISMVGRIYEAFGFELNVNDRIEAVRLDREELCSGNRRILK